MIGPAGVPASSSSMYLTPCSIITPLNAKRASTSATASASSPFTVSETSSQLVIVLTRGLTWGEQACHSFYQFLLRWQQFRQCIQAEKSRLRYLVIWLKYAADNFAE